MRGRQSERKGKEMDRMQLGSYVRIRLPKPYSEFDLQHGCDQRVNGRKGRIVKIHPSGLITIKLDHPLEFDDGYPGISQDTREGFYHEYANALEFIRNEEDN
jgi:hypothetical protein